MHKETIIESPEERKLEAGLIERTDAEAARMRRFMAMPDLSRTPGSPLQELVQRIISLPTFSDFSVVKVPEIVPVTESFDLFDCLLHEWRQHRTALFREVGGYDGAMPVGIPAVSCMAPPAMPKQRVRGFRGPPLILTVCARGTCRGGDTASPREHNHGAHS